MKNLSVLKFGGSSLATPEQIRAVAKKIVDRYREGKKLIIVTSAMGKSTDELTALAYKVSSRPNRRELDMLLSTGERVSMSLMSMALQDFNCPAISFTGSQAGIMTDGAFSNAQIREIKPIRVEEALSQNKVVVLAGFQGVDPKTKEITTLGRGGSDTTAVAMAAHFQADSCEILKDVDGVFSADPKIATGAKLIPSLDIHHLYDMCFWGAKVLNYRSVRWAADHHVSLSIGRSDTFSIGTQVTAHPNTSNTEIGTADTLLAVNSHEFALEISITAASEFEGPSTLQNLFTEAQLPEPQVLRSEYDLNNGVWTALITAPADVIQIAENNFENSAKAKILNKDISTVTATYTHKPCEVRVVERKNRESVIRGFFE